MYDNIIPEGHPGQFFGEDDELVQILQSLPALDTFEFWFANLLKKTDFQWNEIIELLEFNPTEEQENRIKDYVELSNRLEEIGDEIEQQMMNNSNITTFLI